MEARQVRIGGGLKARRKKTREEITLAREDNGMNYGGKVYHNISYWEKLGLGKFPGKY